MTKGQRTVVALLAVVAVLLGLNLFSGTPEAEAQVEEGGAAGAAEVVLIDGLFTHEAGRKLWRFFSDGTVDVRNFSFNNFCNPIDACGAEVGPFVILPPAMPPGSPGPTVVAGRREPGAGVYRFWSDGSVDVTSITFTAATNWCVPVPPSACPSNGPFQIIGPAPYAACSFYDGNFDGTINVLDLIELLLAFGTACP